MADPVLPGNPNPTVPPTVPGEPKVLHVAGWGRRFLAWLIDILVIGAAQAVLLAPWAAFAAVGGFADPGFFTWGLGGIIGFLYWWLLATFNNGRSLGKMALNLQIVNEMGGPPTAGQAAAESAGKAFFLIIDVIVGLFVGKERRQRLTEKLAGLVVVQREPEVREAGTVRFVKG